MSGAPENYHRIGSSIWTEFQTDDSRLMALYVLTCRHRHSEGYYLLPFGYMHEDLGWTPRRTRKAFSDIAATGMLRYDDKRKVVLIMEALRWQSPTNPNQMTAAIKRVRTIPDGDLDRHFYQAALAHAPSFAEELATQVPTRFGTVVATVVQTVVPTGTSNTHAHALALAHAQSSCVAAVVPPATASAA